ncbi:MAG: DNA replication/repair protein RecF [Candidatus Hydrogenedentes bacterium]|nr:DNA replication/repair protein RecF [Candidatus Hydrogenedentota bacterium]
MHLTHVQCRHFRCVDAIEFSPAPGRNIIRGANAQGKTSVLEAILYGATSRSHRTASEGELVQHGEPGFQVRLQAQRVDRSVQVEAFWFDGSKRFKVNGVAQSRISDILGRIHLVFFSPEDVDLIKGAASVRRRFLDMELSQISPGDLAALQQYRQVLRQRNELLRTERPDAAMLDIWDVQLTRHGVVLMEERASYLEELSRHATDMYGRIAGDEPLSLRYEPDVKTPGELAAVLAKSQQTDIRRGATGRGPHRDDVSIEIHGRPARQYGSQGQQKSSALAIKLAELELVRGRIGEYPVLMLDEVLAELDDRRAHQLFEAIPEAVQVLTTTTELDHRQEHFGAGWTSYRIDHGQLQEEA